MARQVFRGMLRSIVVLAAIMLAPAVAEACRCSYEPPQKLVDQADVIFVGTLVASYGAGLFPLERNMTFEVERAWKGAPAKDLNVVGQHCGPWYKSKVGERKVIFAQNEKYGLVGDGCASHNYDHAVRHRSAYDDLLPGHETAADQELRLKQTAELEEAMGRARELLRAGAVLEAESTLSGMTDLLEFDDEGFILRIEIFVMAERERQASDSWLPRWLFDWLHPPTRSLSSTSSLNRA